MIRIVLFSIFFLFLQNSCQRDYKKNKFIITSINVRVVDVVDTNKSKCIVLDDFDLKRENKYIGIGLSFQKEYVSDSTERRLFGVYHQGLDGLVNNIKYLSLSLDLDKNLNNFEDIMPFTSGNKFFPDYYNNFYFNKLGTDSNGCVENLNVDNLDTLKMLFNTNNKKVTGEYLKNEVLLWCEKKHFLEIIKSHENSEFIFILEHYNGKVFKSVLKLQ